MATVRQGSRVRHAEYPERFGRVLRIGERWDPEGRRWERAADVAWDDDHAHWIAVRDLVLVRRGKVSE